MASTSSLVDNFNSNSLSANWTKSGDSAQVNNQNGRIEITHTATAQYNQLTTTTTYSLTSSNFFAQIVDAGNQVFVSHQCVFGLMLDANNSCYMTATNGQFQAWKKVAGALTQIGSNITYSPTTHRWWRISESAGTMSFDSSPDGNTWTNRWTVANPFAITAISPYMQSGCYATESSGSYSYFDNYNFVPPASGGTLSMMGV